MGQETTVAPGAATQPLFATTHWSVVLAAANPELPTAATALERLCRTYWPPIYAYVRRHGHSPEDAQDLTQEFFARLLQQNSIARANPAKGRFRSFLLGALKHTLADQKARGEARRHGGGQTFLSWEQIEAEERLGAEGREELSPDQAFDRRWAMTVLEQASERLRREYDTPNRAKVFEALKGYVTGDASGAPYAAAAVRLGLSESAVKSAIYRLRRGYYALVRDEVAQTVTNPKDLEEEIGYLMLLFSAPGATR